MTKASRIQQAHAQARTAKAVIASGTLLVFGVAFIGARIHAPGPAKGKGKALGAPKSFERAVKRSVADGGVIAPAVQPPPVATSTS